MQVIDINIQALDFKLSLARYEFIERRLSYALSLHDEQIAAVQVWLSKANQDGLDRRCLVQITLVDAQQISVESVEADVDIAVHRAADQASWTVARHLGRRKIQRQTSIHSSSGIGAEPRRSPQM